MPTCTECGKEYKRAVQHVRVCEQQGAFEHEVRSIPRDQLRSKQSVIEQEAQEKAAVSNDSVPGPSCQTYRGIERVRSPTPLLPQSPPRETPSPSRDTLSSPKMTSSPSEVSEPPPRSKAGRAYKLSTKYHNMIPIDKPLLPSMARAETPEEDEDRLSSPSPSPLTQAVDLPSLLNNVTVDEVIREQVKTNPDEFGVFRVYPHQFTHDPSNYSPPISTDDDPDLDNTILPIIQAGGTKSTISDTSSSSAHPNDYAPFRNYSEYQFYTTYQAGTSSKSLSHMEALAKVVSDPNFNCNDLNGFNTARIHKALDDFQWEIPMGWKKTSITLHLPNDVKKGKHRVEEKDAAQHKVENLLYRPLVDIMREFVQENPSMHYTPFELYAKNEDGSDIRIYHELYNSQEFIDEHIQVRRAQTGRMRNGKPLETVIFGLIQYSDSAALAQFGNASIWPIYVMCGNISKYLTSQLSANLVKHHAYMPKLDQLVQDTWKQAYGTTANQEQLKFLRRDLLQRILEALLCNKDVEEAYDRGVEILCPDGQWRLFFLRIFMYICDYMEKAQIFCIRPNSAHLCPRCTVNKKDIHLLGTEQDRQTRLQQARSDTSIRQERIETARAAIFDGSSLTSKDVNSTLDFDSSTPHVSALSDLLYPRGKNFFELASCDVLHEFEAGVWKSIFIHLLRIVKGMGGDYLVELDRRFREMTTFGRGTIRRFRPSTSALKQMAARDFEDILQVSIAVFEGLLPGELDDVVSDMLYTLCLWHGLSKFRMHTADTVALFEHVNTALGQTVRKFAHLTRTTFKFFPQSLDHEIAARGHNFRYHIIDATSNPNGSQKRKRTHKDEKGKGQAKVAKLKKLTETAQAPRNEENNEHQSDSDKESEARYVLNINTAKMHGLGYYPAQIIRLGPLDQSSTQRGELEHQRCKNSYDRSSKRDFIEGIARHETRQRKVNHISDMTSPILDNNDISTMPKAVSLATKYQISKEPSRSVSIPAFVARNKADPAWKSFRYFRDHILSRVLKHPGNTTYIPRLLRRLVILGDVMHMHKVIRVNYTTYDLQRDYDTANPRTNADVMVLMDELENGYPYGYCRILLLFHVEAFDTNIPNQRSKRYNCAYVRWLKPDEEWVSGVTEKRLPRLQFMPPDDPEAFGFIDPASIVRGVHLQPAFKYGVYDYLPTHSSVRLENKNDHRFLYVGIFSTRDHLARFLRCGIGHKYSYNRQRMPSYEFHDSELDSQDSYVAVHNLNDDEDLEDSEEQDRPNLDLNNNTALQVDPEGDDGPGPSYTQRLGYEDD